jgi:hypothetical protein
MKFPKRKMEDAKKQELKTYNSLKLGRDQKSKAKRERLKDKKIYMFVGEGTTERPYIQVLKADYERVWQDIHQQMLKEAAELKMHFSVYDDAQKIKLERTIYDILIVLQDELENLNQSFQKTHGRKMTPHEQELFGKTMKMEPVESNKQPSFAQKADNQRKSLINGLLGKINTHQSKQAPQLARAWTMAVGEQMALETNLERIDDQKGIAYCRCTNSSRTFQLRRQKDLPQKLSDILGLQIKRIVFF